MMHLFITGNEVVYRFDFAHRITTYPEKKIKQFQNPEIIPRPFEQCFDLNLKFELYKERFFLLIFIWTEWFKSKTSSLSCSTLVDCYINQVLY